MMTPEDRSLLEALCTQLLAEKDNKKFSELIQQLITLLERARRGRADNQSSPVLPPVGLRR
jgi:hypothetical protein